MKEINNMAVKGAQAKQEVMQTILNTFGDRAFLYNDGKEIRVDCMENGAPVQIKITLTAAKEAVERGGDNALPAATTAPSNIEAPALETTQIPEPTAAEKHNIEELMRRLGL